MKHFVLNDPALKRFEKRFVFATVDTEQEQNAAFTGQYAMSVWPTLFIIDPHKGDLLGYWPGAASLRELTGFLTDSWDIHEQRQAGSMDKSSALGLFLQAKRAQAAARHREAAELYGKAVEKAETTWSRRDEALLGWIQSLHRSRQTKLCIDVGLRYGKDVKGAAIPADFTRYFFSCTTGEANPQRKAQARAAAISRLEQLVASPPPDASADDRADAWEILADAREEMGDKAGARKAHEERLALLEAAAAKAPSPAAAATFDYGRAVSYAALGQRDKAVTMLRARVKQLPDSYEPPARLASVLAQLGRYAEALTALAQALEHAEGPRRLGYLQKKADLQLALKDHAGRVKTLEEEVALWQKLAQRQSGRAAGLAEARRRLAAAKRAAGR
jgi:tetratricopeptide (TPR) repeat protein